MIVEGKIETEINEDIEKEIYECFSLFDTSKSGYIDIREFYFALRSLGLNFKKEQVKKLFLEIKNNIDDKLNFDEFFDIASKHINTRYNEEEIDNMFSLFDPNDTGKITLSSLKAACDDIGRNDKWVVHALSIHICLSEAIYNVCTSFFLGEHIEESELKRMIDYADKNNDKSIDKSEFKNLVLSIWKNALLSDLDSDYE